LLGLTPVLQVYSILVLIAYGTNFILSILIIKDQLMKMTIIAVIVLGINWGKQTHITISNELKDALIKSGLPSKNVVYSQNGYTASSLPSSYNHLLIETVTSWASHFQKIAVFSGNGHLWHSINDMDTLFNAYPQVGIIIIGPYTPPKTAHPQFFYTGKVDIKSLSLLYQCADFALSLFSWDTLKLNITEGSPLKTRDYLCHGLPILTNYDDCAEDFDDLKPYIFNYKHHKKKAIDAILSAPDPKSQIKDHATRLLSWEHLWQLNKIVIPLKL